MVIFKIFFTPYWVSGTRRKSNFWSCEARKYVVITKWGRKSTIFQTCGEEIAFEKKKKKVFRRSFHPYLRLSQSVGCLIVLSFGPSLFNSLAFFWRLTAHVKISWCPLYHCHCPSECKWGSRLFDLALSVCLPVHRLVHSSNHIRHYIFLFIYMFMSTHSSIPFPFCNSLPAVLSCSRKKSW